MSEAEKAVFARRKELFGAWSSLVTTWIVGIAFPVVALGSAVAACYVLYGIMRLALTWGQ